MKNIITLVLVLAGECHSNSTDRFIWIMYDCDKYFQIFTLMILSFAVIKEKQNFFLDYQNFVTIIEGFADWTCHTVKPSYKFK